MLLPARTFPHAFSERPALLQQSLYPRIERGLESGCLVHCAAQRNQAPNRAKSRRLRDSIWREKRLTDPLTQLRLVPLHLREIFRSVS